MNTSRTSAIQAQEVSPQELEAALAHIRSGKPPRLVVTSVADLLKAVELGVVDKSEARRQLGYGPTRGRAASTLQRKGGKFVKRPKADGSGTVEQR